MITWTKRLSWVQVLSRLARSRRLTEAERDACAAGVDRCSELGATVDEGRDFIDVIVDEVGAPDGSSLISSIRDLRARALERERALSSLDAGEAAQRLYRDSIDVLTAERDDKKRELEGLRREYVARCKEAKELRAMLEVAREQLKKFSVRCEELKCRVAELESTLRSVFAAAGMRLTVPSGDAKELTISDAPRPFDELLADVVQHVDHMRRRAEALNAALESAPLHPAIARVFEAATVYMRADAITMSTSLNDLSSAVDALPSPLPRVVTCGECVMSGPAVPDGIMCNKLRKDVPPEGFCHVGVRREVKP